MPEWLIVLVVLVIIGVTIGVASLVIYAIEGPLQLKTGKLSVTVTNYDSEDRQIALFIDGKHTDDETIPVGYRWSILYELSWTEDDPIKTVSLFSAGGTETKQVQMVEDSIVTVSFDIY